MMSDVNYVSGLIGEAKRLLNYASALYLNIQYYDNPNAPKPFLGEYDFYVSITGGIPPSTQVDAFMTMPARRSEANAQLWEKYIITLADATGRDIDDLYAELGLDPRFLSDDPLNTYTMDAIRALSTTELIALIVTLSGEAASQGELPPELMDLVNDANQVVGQYQSAIALDKFRNERSVMAEIEAQVAMWQQHQYEEKSALIKLQGEISHIPDAIVGVDVRHIKVWFQTFAAQMQARHEQLDALTMGWKIILEQTKPEGVRTKERLEDTYRRQILLASADAEGNLDAEMIRILETADLQALQDIAYALVGQRDDMNYYELLKAEDPDFWQRGEAMVGSLFFLAGFIPFVGTALDVVDAVGMLLQGNVVGAAVTLLFDLDELGAGLRVLRGNATDVIEHVPSLERFRYSLGQADEAIQKVSDLSTIIKSRYFSPSDTDFTFIFGRENEVIDDLFNIWGMQTLGKLPSQLNLADFEAFLLSEKWGVTSYGRMVDTQPLEWAWPKSVEIGAIVDSKTGEILVAKTGISFGSGDRYIDWGPTIVAPGSPPINYTPMVAGNIVTHRHPPKSGTRFMPDMLSNADIDFALIHRAQEMRMVSDNYIISFKVNTPLANILAYGDLANQIAEEANRLQRQLTQTPGIGQSLSGSVSYPGGSFGFTVTLIPH
jgi:hypothetical protein